VVSERGRDRILQATRSWLNESFANLENPLDSNLENSGGNRCLHRFSKARRFQDSNRDCELGVVERVESFEAKNQPLDEWAADQDSNFRA
jgi:hypothetical protein